MRSLWSVEQRLGKMPVIRWGKADRNSEEEVSHELHELARIKKKLFVLFV
jgi:hypothetical protein